MKPFSIEWVNYHCFLHPVNYFRDILLLLFFLATSFRDFGIGIGWAALLLFGAGFALHVLQRRKLKFKSIPLSGQPDGLKDQIRKLLSDEGWRIEYDNQRYLQAINRKGIPYLDCDLLILSWRSDEIRWALVYDPWYNIAGGIFTFNRYGRKTVKAIKALAAEPAETPAPRKLG